MAVYIVVINPYSEISEYSPFEKAISAYSRCQITEFSWLVDTNLEIGIVRNELTHELCESARLFITEIRKNWTFYHGGRPEEWLQSPKRRWRLHKRKSLLQRLCARNYRTDEDS